MNTYFPKRQNWIIRLGAAVFLLWIGNARGDSTPVAQASPISYTHIVRHDPDLSIYVVRIKLDDARVSVHVARGGPDPDGEGPWLTTLLPTSEIAEREHFDLAINGDFFTAKSTKDVEGRNTGYVRGKFAAPEGMAMTDGNLWHRSGTIRPFLEILSNATAVVAGDQAADRIDPGAREVIGGSHIIVRHGKPIRYETKFAIDRHPRTVVGLARVGHELVFLVVDGRQPRLSIGMTLAELSEEMIQLGCDDAINLDGGGSTTLVYRDPATTKLKVLNSPSDTVERSVADVLGVQVKAPLPKPK